MHLKLPIGICVGIATVVVGSSRDLVDLALNYSRGRGVLILRANLNRSCSHKVVEARAGRKKVVVASRAGRKVVAARHTGRTSLSFKLTRCDFSAGLEKI